MRGGSAGGPAFAHGLLELGDPLAAQSFQPGLDLGAAGAERLAHLFGHAGDLEVPPFATGVPLDREAELTQLPGQVPPEARAELAAMLQHGAVVDRHDPSVGANRSVDEAVHVQLWIGSAVLHGARGGMSP